MLAIFVILYSVFIADLARIPVFPTINRVTFFGPIVSWTPTGDIRIDMLLSSVFLFAALLLSFRRMVTVPLVTGSLLVYLLFWNSVSDWQIIPIITFVASLPIYILLCFLHSKYYPSLGHSPFHTVEFLSLFIMVFSSLQLLSIAGWLLHNPYDTYSNAKLYFAKLNSDIFYALGLLSPYLLLLSTSSFLFRAYVIRFLKKALSISKLYVNVRLHEGQDSRHASYLKTFLFQEKVLLILFAVMPSIFFSVYPYVSLQRSDVSLATDIPSYSSWLSDLRGAPDMNSFLTELFVNINDGGRPLSIFIIYVVSFSAGNNDILVLKYLPIILGPLLVLSVYYFMKIAYPTRNNLPVISAIMTAMSHQIVIGFYAGFYSNWMALIVANIGSAVLLKNMQSSVPRLRLLLLFGCLNILCLLIHSYTWTFFAASSILFLIWSGIQDKRKKRSVSMAIFLGIIVLSIVMVDEVRSHYITSTGGIEKDLSIADSRITYEEFFSRWYNLQGAFRFYLGGYLTNIVTFGALFVWSIKADYDQQSDRFLLSFIFIIFLPILFGDYLVQSRILYNIPLQLPISIILANLLSSRIVFRKYLFVGLLLFQLDYIIRAMSNMYYLDPLALK